MSKKKRDKNWFKLPVGNQIIYMDKVCKVAAEPRKSTEGDLAINFYLRNSADEFVTFFGSPEDFKKAQDWLEQNYDPSDDE
jgi:hypothetical protein